MKVIPFARAFMGGQVPRYSGSFSPRHLLRRYYKNCYLFFIICPFFPSLIGSYYNTRINNYSQPLFSKGGQ